MDNTNLTIYLNCSVQYSKSKYVFSLTGKTWALIKQYYPELIPKVVTRGAIFARMSPDQKQQLVQELQSLGYYVGKCEREREHTNVRRTFNEMTHKCGNLR